MNREFEILNEKLNTIFEEIMWLRQDFQREKFEKERKELECKVKNAQDELKYKTEDRRFVAERLDDSRNQFRNINNMFPKEDVK